MADTFFGFGASLDNGDHLLPPDEDDCIENEDEYDALNDETFGTLEDCSALDDWEQQHEQFAEYAKSSKQSEQNTSIEDSLNRLIIDDEPISLSKSSVWAYTPPGGEKNGDFFSGSIISNLQKVSQSFIQAHHDGSAFAPSPIHQQHQQQPPRHIPTVEELEKSFIKSTKQQPLHPPPPPLQQQQQQQYPPGRPPNNMYPPPRFPPPGLSAPPQPLMRHMIPPPPPPHHPHLPPGLMHHHPMMAPPPRFMHHHPPHHPGGPPRMMYQQHHPSPPGPPPNFFMGRGMFPPPHPSQQQQQQHPPPANMMMMMMRGGVNNGMVNNFQNLSPAMNMMMTAMGGGGGGEVRDEYAGLMSAREKQWLLNIQLLQLNTGTPYFDDYYYTVFKEKQAKNNKENKFPGQGQVDVVLGLRFHGGPGGTGNNNNNNNNNGGGMNNKHHHRNGQQDNNNTTLTPRVYTPLQFENSLGKLQCGSVTAPRKIIDMDIVTPDKDSDNPVAQKDTRKTKQLLLELEALYSLLLKAEDLRNPLAISNVIKLREIKQKQRLRELDMAPTAEAKQQVLKLLKQDSEPVIEHPHDYIVRITTTLTQDDKFSSFLNIRKGKMLLLRLLPHLSMDGFGPQLAEIWTRTLLSVPIIGRRDTSGDHLLPKLHPFFKRFVQTCSMGDVLDVVSSLVETIRPSDSRSTPLSHQGKAPLYFVLSNKFGVSALATMLIRTEYLLSSDSASDKQQGDWSRFLTQWAELTGVVAKVAQPIEPVPLQIFSKHANRFEGVLTGERRAVLEKFFADSGV